MGLFGKSKRELTNENYLLAQELNRLQSLMTPELQSLDNVNRELTRAQDNLMQLERKISTYKYEISQLEREISLRKSEIIELDEVISLQDFGLYSPIYKFANSEQYKDRLTTIRQQQKNMVRNKTATESPTNFTLDGSRSESTRSELQSQR